MNNDLISRSALKEEFAKHEDRKGYLIGDWEDIIDNAPPVEVPEDEVNCVLTMFGKCSYNETGCSDCEIKDKIRKALNARPQGDIIDIIKSITDDISIKKDVNGYRPIKNTSKDSCYKALFEIIELLRNSGNIGGEEDV